MSGATVHWLAPEFGVALLLRPQARAWVEQGLHVADVGVDFDELRDRVAGGEYRAVMIHAGAELAAVMVLEIVFSGNPSKKTLAVVVAGGERLYEWLGAAQRSLRQIAATHHCERVIVAGRPGWERALRDYGWKKTGVILQADPQGWNDN